MRKNWPSSKGMLETGVCGWNLSITYVTFLRYVTGINHESLGLVAPRGPSNSFRKRTEHGRDLSNLCRHNHCFCGNRRQKPENLVLGLVQFPHWLLTLASPSSPAASLLPLTAPCSLLIALVCYCVCLLLPGPHCCLSLPIPP